MPIFADKAAGMINFSQSPPYLGTMHAKTRGHSGSLRYDTQVTRTSR